MAIADCKLGFSIAKVKNERLQCPGRCEKLSEACGANLVLISSQAGIMVLSYQAKSLEK